MVHVAHHQGEHPLVAARDGDLVGEVRVEVSAVRESRERVVQRTAARSAAFAVARLPTAA
jgi:hypothetical protein